MSADNKNLEKIPETSAEAVLRFLKEYNAHFTDVYKFYSEKLGKVLGDDLVWLIESLNEEERLTMKSESMEQKRLLVFEENGAGGLAAPELAEAVPANFGSSVRSECNIMVKLTSDIKRLSADILETIERKLDSQTELAKEHGLVQVQSYNKGGAKVKMSAETGYIGAI